MLPIAIVALSASILASAAEPGRSFDAHKRYLEDRAYCLSGKSSEDKATCLREAGAAQNDAKHGRLSDANADFEKNRLARCGYLSEPDREYCIRRMHGEGTTSGSVAGGGILRELVVTVPADEATAGGRAH